MSIETRPTAGTNERKFEALFRAQVPDAQLLGKRQFAEENVRISVDQSFTYKDTTYLIEVDSGNMAKLLVGQYILLNQLVPEEEKPAFFVVVHAYRAYNPGRTIANLSLVNRALLEGKGIPFGAVHFDTITSGWSDGVSGFLDCLVSPTSG